MTAAKPIDRPVAWILPEGHRSLPKDFNTLDLKVYRLRSHLQINAVRPSRPIVIAWDWRRADGIAAEHYPEDVISSMRDLPPDTGKIPLIVSGPGVLAESLCRELDRAVYWLSIDGKGATDPEAVWASWLTGVASISIELFACSDAKRWDRYGARELRVHPSSPALTHMALLRASVALVERLALRSDPEGSVDARRVCEAHRVSDCSLLRSWPQSFRVTLQIASKTIEHRVTRSGQLTDHWVIGIKQIEESFRNESFPKLPELREFHWIEPGCHRFIADPFLARVGENVTLFFEELFYSDWKGRLKALPLGPSGRPAGPEVTVLEKPYHLSFPFVFEHASETDSIFLLPEQAASGNTILYRSAKATKASLLHFEQDTIVLPGFPGVDPVICEWKGRFYLFVTDGSYGNYDNNLQLFVSEGLRGVYRVHPKSPIKVGLRGSRMAGLLVQREGKLYRPAQDCRSRYGAQVILQCVDRLSPTDYHETEVAMFFPDAASAYGLGLHTVVWCEGLVAIDGLRRIVVPEAETGGDEKGGKGCYRRT